MPEATQVKKSSWGCAKYAAVGCAVLLLLGIIGGFIAYRCAKGYVSNMVTQYAATKPQKLPSAEGTAQEAEDTAKRLEEFAKALKEDRPAPEIAMTSEELNTLIQKHPQCRELAEKIHLELEGDKLKGEVSLPLDKLGEMFKGRYLNGSAVFRVGMTEGRLQLFIDTLTIKGQPAPEEFMKFIRAKNLADEVYKKPEAAAIIEKLGAVTVRDGTLILTPKKTQ